MTLPKIEIRLSITGESMDFESITRALGVPPTKSWKRGDPVNRTGARKHPKDAWVRRGEAVRTVDLESRVLLLVDGELSQAAQALEDLRGNGRAKTVLHCYVHCGDADTRANLSLTRGTLEKLSRLGLDLNTEVYW